MTSTANATRLRRERAAERQQREAVEDSARNTSTPAELALLAAQLCADLDKPMFKAALAKYGVQHSAKRTDAIDFETFAHLDPLTLVKLAVEALLSLDISRMHYARDARFASWYAGPPPKPASPRRSKKGAFEVTPYHAAPIHDLNTAESGALELVGTEA